MLPPRLHGLVCIRNEAARYLRRCLQWHLAFLDDVFVYDDQSTDDSVAIARELGALVEVRPDRVVPFIEHEGEFRQAAWEAFEIAVHPEAGDWVLAFDADEFLVHPRGIDPGWLLRHTAAAAMSNQTLGCRIAIHEVFDIADETPLVRTDGFWGQINGLRFFEYRTGGRFTNRKLACGSTPFYVAPVDDAKCVDFLHFGYARLEDRIAKHNRYSNLPGHSRVHIDSILGPPELVPWDGEVPL